MRRSAAAIFLVTLSTAAHAATLAETGKATAALVVSEAPTLAEKTAATVELEGTTG